MDTSNLRFFNPYEETRHTKNWLPHWQQEGAVYFVTFRLADAVPQSLVKAWESERSIWLGFHPQPWTVKTELEYHQRFSGTIERWLDAGHGSCLLRRTDCAQSVGNALQHFDGERYAQIAWVVMPNHVHLIFLQCAEWPLETLLHSWKRFTARQINQLIGRSGNLWHRDYFDRLVRDATHFANCVRYLRRNPKKARLSCDRCLSYENAIAKSVE
jgi:REP element-mobilizing transposase RayT